MTAATRTAAVVLLLAVVAAPAAAQGAGSTQPSPSHPQLRRLDVTGLAGWVADRQPASGEDYYDDWNNRWHGAAAVGWYWTPHLKTEVEVGLTDEGETWASRQSGIRGPDGYPIPIFERRFHRDVTVAFTQQWQFLENAWVHPFVSAGVSLDHERTRHEVQDAYYWPNRPLPPSLLPVAVETHVRARGLVGTGFKGYFNERAFIRGDIHVALASHGVAQVRSRLGLGVDF